MDAIRVDVARALRRLRQSPSFSLTVLVTLALGIGANTAMFSVVDSVLLRPLPFADSSSLVEVRMVNPSGSALLAHGYEAFSLLREQRELFGVFEGYAQRNMVLVGSSEPVSVNVAPVTGGIMPTLGIAPHLGRAIDASDADPNRPGVIVLSEKLWRERFAGAADVVGRVVRLDQGAYEVIGVMPSAFRFPRATTEAWTALPIAQSSSPGGSPARPVTFMTLARIAPGISIEAVQGRLDTLTPRFAAWMPRGDGWSLRVQRFNEQRANPEPRRAMWILFGGVSLLLLIACANVANLLVTRGAARRREMAIRAAVGASRTQLVREVFIETFALVAAGGAAGVALAIWLTDVLLGIVPRSLTFLSLSAIAVDARVLLFAVCATLVCALLVAVVPAIRAGRPDVQEALTGARGATASVGQRRVMDLVVAVEMALSLALLVAAGLLIRTFTHVTKVDPGFDTRNLVTFAIDLPTWSHPTSASAAAFWSSLQERVAAVPGVAATTVAPGMPPGAGGIMFDLHIETEGDPEIVADPELELPASTVRPEYFRVLGIPLLAGRNFSAADSPQAPPALIVNQAMARRFWPAGDAVGRRIRFDADQAGSPGRGRWYTVVGIVGNVYQFDHAKTGDAMAIYHPASQSPSSGGGRYQTLVVRTTDDSKARIADLRAAIRSLAPDLPIYRIETVDQAYTEFLAAPRFNALLMGLLAGSGLLFAVVGLYGVMAYSTALRTAEFGIRMALGARQRDVATLVLLHGAVVAGSGIAAGIAVAIAASAAIGRLLVGVTALDPATYIGVASVLAASGLVACWLPARRAVRVDPVMTLRDQ